MEKTIFIRYGEIFLKGNNRYVFENILIANIKAALKGFDYKFNHTQGRYMIDNYPENQESRIVDKLVKVFGIHSVSVAAKIESDEQKIKQTALLFAPKNGTFRVTVRRADKKIAKPSMQLAAEIGEVILESNPDLTVDLTNFDCEIFVDMRQNGYSYIFTDVIDGAQGMPVGCSGQGMLLLSGGIDSPVAGFLMARRGLKINAVHFHSMPYTSEQAKQKVVELANLMSQYTGDIKLSVVPFTHIQEEIHANCPPELMVTIMRRFMMRIAERLAKAEGCGAVITGESLGQVASQTMQSMTVTNDVIESLPVFRPLIGLDKSDIIAISQKIGTFKTSILPYQDCCTIFLPKNPAIRPKLDFTKKAESSLDVEGLIAEALAGVEVIRCGD